MGKCTETFFDKILPEQFMWPVSRYEIFNKSQFKHVQYFYFSLCYFFNYYTILCLFLILILPTVHTVLWGFYIMLHRLGYHWGPTCYFTLSTWCVSTVQVSCTWILMKQWQFKPQEVKKKQKNLHKTVAWYSTCPVHDKSMDTSLLLCMLGECESLCLWIMLVATWAWDPRNRMACQCCLNSRQEFGCGRQQR